MNRYRFRFLWNGKIATISFLRFSRIRYYRPSSGKVSVLEKVATRGQSLTAKNQFLKLIDWKTTEIYKECTICQQYYVQLSGKRLL